MDIVEQNEYGDGLVGKDSILGWIERWPSALSDGLKGLEIILAPTRCTNKSESDDSDLTALVSDQISAVCHKTDSSSGSGGILREHMRKK